MPSTSIISITMSRINLMVFLSLSIIVSTRSEQSAVGAIQDIYRTCIQEFSFSCVKPKTVQWLNANVDKSVIRITEDLVIRKKIGSEYEDDRRSNEDILDKFEEFLQNHEVIAKAPAILRPDGPFGQYIPRNFQATDLSVPLAATGRSSKLIKRVIFPFLLGLKFKTAILVPLALALIALKTWKALTLGLLSLVLSGSIAIFSKLMGPKVPAYEVLHYQPHVAYPHLDVLPAPVAQPVYLGRNLDSQEMAYSSYTN